MVPHRLYYDSAARTSLGATTACPLVIAHIAYAAVTAPFHSVTAPNNTRYPGCDTREEAKLGKASKHGESGNRKVQEVWLTRQSNDIEELLA